MNTQTIKTASNVIVIPALSQSETSPKRLKQTRVAAYCRVSTDVLHSYDQLLQFINKLNKSPILSG